MFCEQVCLVLRITFAMINTNRFVLSCCLFAALALPGCIVQDIRDNLNKANTSLPEVDGRIAQTSTALSTTNTHLEGIDTNLGTTVTGLSQTNEQIKSIEANLAKTNQSLEVVERNLVQVNQHLAGLRTTISKLDSTIPFLDLGGDTPIENTVIEPAPAATTEPAKDGAVQTDSAAAPDAGAAASTNTQTTRDSLVGPWVSADPNRPFTLLLLQDGRFVSEQGYEFMSSGNQTRTEVRHEEGTWKRDTSGSSLIIVLTPYKQENTDKAAAQLQPQPARYRVLHQTSRTLSLESGSRLFVLKKP